VWGNEPSHSQVSSHFGSWNPDGLLNFWKSDCKGQNPLDWRVHYIIRKLLECRCLNTSNISYGQKKGRESNWQFDSQPLKVRNHLDFLACKWRATYRWKAIDEGYNFALDLISIKGLHTKLWAPKFMEVPTLGILGLPLGSLGTKWHLGVGPVARHKVYYKGEGGGFPQIQVVMSLMSLCLLVVRPCTKLLQLRTNQLVVWFVQVRVSNRIIC
jgi:hypothetical protein